MSPSRKRERGQDATPRYMRLKTELLDDFAGLRVGAPIPSQREIMDRSGLAYETVSRALRELVSEGYVRRHRGQGSVLCRRPGDLCGKVGFYFMRGQSHNFALAKVVERFRRRHPPVEIADLSADAEGFGAADAIEVTSTSFAYLAPGFAPLSGRVAARAERAFDARALAPVRFRGRLVGLPIVVSPQVLYANEDLLAEAGVGMPAESGDAWKWDDLLSRARAAHAPERGRFGWASHRDLQTLAPFVWQNEGRLFDGQGIRCMLGEPAAVEAIRFWRELERLSPLGPDDGPRAATEAFLAGRVAFLPFGGMLERSLTERAAFRWRAMRLPAGKCEATSLRFAALAVRRRARDLAAAESLAEGLLDAAAQRSLLEARIMLPASREILASGDARLEPHVSALAAARCVVEPAVAPACATLEAALRLLWEGDCAPEIAARHLALIADSALRGAALGLPAVTPEI